ncbi:MAG: DUF2905 domain-containing protein [Methylococcales bacterium]|nr:DUF2905 domain-containing protein [Methylococcales bacterium]
MEPGKILISVGVLIVLAGLVLNYLPWLIDWFGKLPGDINIRNENSVIFIPITSMIVISLLLTLLVNLFFRK